MSEENTLDITLHNVSLDQLEGPGEDELIRVLAKRIAEMLDHEPDLLFSTLYRLDVLESRINAVLHSPVDPAWGLAKLVLERQKEKLKTRAAYGKGREFDMDP